MEHAVSCIVFSPDRLSVLLIKRQDVPVWVLPGGGIDPGESPEQAAVREMHEETGYHTQIKRKVAEYSPRNRFSKPTHFFELEIVSGTPTTGEETAALAFFPIDHLPKPMPPPYAYWIQDALEGRAEMIRKEVEGTSYGVFIKLLLLHPVLVCRFLLTKCGIRF